MNELPLSIARSAAFASEAYQERKGEPDCIRLDGKYDGQAFVRKLDMGELVVVFRGSESIMDWCINLMRYKVKFPGITGAHVHAGFYKQYSYLRTKVLESVRTHIIVGNVGRILVTGHSLGASLATMFAVDLATLYPELRVMCHSFCAPRIGDRAFVTGLDSIPNLHVLRIYNPSDLITWFPRVGFFHSNKTYAVRSPGLKWYQFQRKHSLDQFCRL